MLTNLARWIGAYGFDVVDQFFYFFRQEDFAFEKRLSQAIEDIAIVFQNAFSFVVAFVDDLANFFIDFELNFFAEVAVFIEVAS